jgi:hypothetical protein
MMRRQAPVLLISEADVQRGCPNFILPFKSRHLYRTRFGSGDAWKKDLGRPAIQSDRLNVDTFLYPWSEEEWILFSD